jgi:hypothetical protein
MLYLSGIAGNRGAHRERSRRPHGATSIPPHLAARKQVRKLAPTCLGIAETYGILFYGFAIACSNVCTRNPRDRGRDAGAGCACVAALGNRGSEAALLPI